MGKLRLYNKCIGMLEVELESVRVNGSFSDGFLIQVELY